MAWFLMVAEVADDNGVGKGCYRQVAKSDERRGGTHGLCKHEHPTKELARDCPEANASHHYYGLNTPRPRR
jgi:hypothetical protein